MDYTKEKTFAEGLANLAKEHGFTIMIGDGKNLVEKTKGLEGLYMFFTKGEKVLALRGGEKMVDESSITLTLHKNRYEKNEINAEWARKQTTSVLNDKVKKQLDTCLNAIERAVAANEKSTYVYINAHTLTLEDLIKRNFIVKQEDNQMDGAYLRISW